ncbi:hypothetical protein [Streptomyces sp. NBC_00454]|uniref:hypothetical protein n=1 Tax=Streptomyces sp. NBC_00454 TaxID=2975747 RepID=UPI00324FE12D
MIALLIVPLLLPWLLPPLARRTARRVRPGVALWTITTATGALGRLFRILPGPRRPAPHLAALPGHPSTSSTRVTRQRGEARHRTTRT